MKYKTITYDYTKLISTDIIQEELKKFHHVLKNEDYKITKYLLINSNIKLKTKYLMINLFNLYLINKYKLTLDTNKLFLDKITNDKIHEIMNIIYSELVLIYDNSDDTYFYNNIYKNLKFDFWYMFNWINNFSLRFCQRYIGSLDIYHLSKLYTHSEISKIIKDPIDSHSTIKTNEKKIEKNKNKLIKQLSKLDIPENQLKDPIKLGLLNTGQLGHCLYMIGYRTDVNDNTIPKLIKKNYIEGLNDSIDFIIEAIADRKSRLYNRLLMPNCQYFNRQLQLLAYTIKNIYSEDCKSNKFIQYYVDENNYKNLEGKYIDKYSIDSKVIERLSKDNKKLKIRSKYPEYVLLTKDILPYFIGTFINMRSAMTCCYSDGCCIVCGGMILEKYMNREFNLGNLLITEFNQNTTQKVLSAKHFQVTTSREFNIPDELENILERKGKYIYFKSNIKLKNIEIGFDIKDSKTLLNISSNNNLNENEIYESNFGKYRSVIFRKRIGKNNYKYMTDIVELRLLNLKRYPTLTKPFISYLLQNHELIKQGENILWIDLSKYNKKLPLFNIPIINYSIRIYYENIKNFIMKHISSYIDLSRALEDFSDIVFEKSSINIIYLEIILKLLLVHNNIDLFPTSGDTEGNITFNNLSNILRYRHLGVSMAYQGHLKTLRNPLFYLIPKEISPLDIFLNLK